MKLLEPKTNTVVSLKNVLLATDFSPAADVALPYAIAFSRRYGSTLHAAHVIPEIDVLVRSEAVNPMTIDSIYQAEQRESREKMQHLASGLEGIPHHTYIRRGEVWDVLSGIVRKQEIDLLVVGTHGRTGVGKLLMGSVAEEILRQAACPVLTVGPKVSGRVKQEFQANGKDFAPVEIELRQIVFATDFTPQSLAAAPFAISLAQEFQARLSLLHVLEKFGEHLHERPGPIEGALQRLENLVPKEATLWRSPEPMVRFGSPAECILQTASDRNADLIVLGVRPANGHVGAATHLPWATAHRVIAQASCPVLTVRG